MRNPPLYFVQPYLKTKKIHPENQETPIEFISDRSIPSSLFYRRNHFPYPKLTSENYRFPITGLVRHPRIFSWNDLKRLPSKTLKVVLECSGNKRSFFEPKTFGEQWEKGAISQGEWRGVPLRTLLEITGIEKEAEEVIVEGYDYGYRSDLDRLYPYARSLPLEKAVHPDTLIAYEYNNEPIPFKHGFPFRLIVPQWYAMASVKWIKQIHITNTAFKGAFQTIDYVYYPSRENDEGAYPVTTMNVNSTIQSPLDMEILNTGRHTIRGIAWTGIGSISNIEVSIYDGETWNKMRIEASPCKSYEWCTWAYEWDVSRKGEYIIKSRAIDSYNRSQPKKPLWNKKGYGYNAEDQVKVLVE